MASGKTTIFMVGFFVLAASLAGCAGKGKATVNGDLPASASKGIFDDDTCAIEGYVSDDEENPVAGAQVGILGAEDPKHKTLTAADGSYSLSQVPPGSPSVAAIKPGYEGDVRVVQCEAGTSVTTQFSLIKIPDPLTSYNRVYGPTTGRIACGVGFGPVATNGQLEPCRLSGIDPDTRQQLNVKPDVAPITGAVYELEWTPTSGFGSQFLRMGYNQIFSKQFETHVTDEKLHAGNIISGKSPIQVTFKTLDGSQPLYTFNAQSNMTFDVRPHTGESPTYDDASKVVIGQTFTLWVTLFYVGDPIPEGYTALGGG